MKKDIEKSLNMNLDKFDHKKADLKWIGKWEKEKIFQPNLSSSRHPFYNLMMFPYPSAEGLHVGNMYAFAGADIYGRFMRMQGNDVFEPIGLDGFGIHSENYALRIGEHPAKLAKKTEANFYRQLHEIGNAFSWGSKLETYDQDYYSWTQWIFIKLFKAGLAYRGTAEVNWCPKDLTVLADEQVIAQQLTVKGQQLTKYVCERCGTTVKKKELTQWFFRITSYAERLIDNIDSLDWSEKVKVAQHNWIGKSEGASIVFTSDIEDDSLIEVFTTRPDTIYGVTYLALAPEHPLVIKILKKAKSLLREEIQNYLDQGGKKNERVIELESKTISSEGKTGVFTGFYALNPINKKRVPIYIADYVLTSYGAGAVMGVPAHDQRDWDFAKKYKIDIVEVIKPTGDSAKNSVLQGAFMGTGILINSGEFNDMESDHAIKRIIKYIKENQIGSDKKMWHLRDWIISRQRYWGPPIPMIFCKKCAKARKSWFTENKVSKASNVSKESKVLVNKLDWDHYGWYPVPENLLPVELPYIEKFKPTGSGISPLAANSEFVNVNCPECGASAQRETDVSDTFLDSSWYFLRYPSVNPRNSNQIQNSKLSNFKSELPWDREITKKWLPVDMYIGGAEHSVLHLLYSRFVTMVFKDLDFIDFEEPFIKFRAHGLLVKDGAKMSKSKGNVVNPDEYIEKFGVDTLRMYLMFCGRYGQGGDFRDTGIEGMNRFLARVWRLVNENLKFKIENLKLEAENQLMMHKAIKKVTEDISELFYNTAIAAMMKWVNFLEKKAVDCSSIRQVQDEQLRVQSSDKKTMIREPITRDEVETLLLLLAPFAPIMTEELWQKIKVSRGSNGSKVKSNQWSIHLAEWPKFDENLARSVQIELIVQVNGRLRDKIKTERGVTKEKIEGIAKGLPQVAKYLESKQYKTIFVPDRIINFVTE